MKSCFQGFVPLKKLANNMGIEFDLVTPTDNSEDFGYKKADGNWTGLMRKFSWDF